MSAVPPAALGWRVDTEYSANGSKHHRIYLKVDGKEHLMTRENLVMLRDVAEEGIKLLPAPYMPSYGDY